MRRILPSTILTISVVLGANWAPAPASADSPSDVAQARALFEQAMREAREGHHEAACRSLTTAVALHDAASIRFNLGVCHRELGHTAEARRQFLAAADLDRVGDVARRARALEAAASLSAPPAVAVSHEAPSIVAVDARPRVRAPRVPASPREVARRARPRAGRRVVLERPTAPRRVSSSDSSIVEQWWFWAGIGTAVVGTVVGVVAASSGGDEPRARTSIGGVIQTLVR